MNPTSGEQGESSDLSLLKRIEAGESDAAMALYLRYAQRLHHLAERQTGTELAARIDPEDIVQSVFRTFFRRASAGLYDIPAGDELWKLFLVIALNKVRRKANYHRAAKRDVRMTSSVEEVAREPRDGTADEQEALRILRMTIDDELGKLSESEAKVISLRIEGYGIQEISERTRCARRTVERVLQRFRKQLDQAMGEETGDAD